MESRKGGGRRRRADERARLVGEYLKSGKSAAEFARSHGVTEVTVERWVKESGTRTPVGTGECTPRRLIPVMVGQEVGGAEHIEIALADGTTVRVPLAVEPGRLEALMAAVRRAC